MRSDHFLFVFLRVSPMILMAFCGAIKLSAQSGDRPTTAFISKIEPDKPPGRLKLIQGKNHSVNARVNMPVRMGDSLILEGETRASVACPDSKGEIVIVPLRPGRQGCPCAEPCPPEICGIEYKGSLIKLPRGSDTQNTQYPIVISPRSSLLRNLRPEVRWAPIAGGKAVTYRVTIHSENMRAVWSREVDSKTTLAYPDKEPPLAPGRVYKVIVTAQGRSSEEESLPGLGFETLTAEQAGVLEQDEQKRKQLGFSHAETRVLIANLYAAKDLYSEAIEQLDRAFDTTKDPVIARKLGDLYMQIGLNREAEKRYIEALSLLDPDDLDGVGLTQKNLAAAYEQLGIFNHAVARLDAAITAYEQLGDFAAVEELKKRRQILKNDK